MAAKSPNYPAVDLSTALAGIKKALDKENRNKMSRLVLAKHLGYNSLSGRALGMLGAVRSYGLVEGSGDELKISDDAVHAIRAPQDSDDRRAALERLATRPPLFRELRADFPDTLPSEDNIQYWLAKKQFTGKGASKAAKSYLTTMRLVEESPAEYNPSDEVEEELDMQTQVGEPRPSTPRSAPAPTALQANAPLRVVMNGSRLDIQASVDLEGLKKLQTMLQKYQSILEMMEPESR